MPVKQKNYSPPIADLLRTYGIANPKALWQVIKTVRPYSEVYATKLFYGHLPISRNVALAIREHTRGALTMDALMATRQDRDGR